MTKKIPIVVIALKVTAKKGLSNFRRNQNFYTSFVSFYTGLITAIANNPSCMEIKQQDNTIIIIWNYSDNNIESLIQGYHKLHLLLLQINKSFPSCQIKYFLAVEFANCQFHQISSNSKAPKFLIESDMIERTQKVLSCLDGKIYPSIMLTHAFHELLSEQLKKSMNKPYYFYHICCYSYKKHFH